MWRSVEAFKRELYVYQKVLRCSASRRPVTTTRRRKRYWYRSIGIELSRAELVAACILGIAASPVRSIVAQASRDTRADTVRLTLVDARARAMRGNPELVAARLDTAIATGELRQATLPLRFNPIADVLGARGGNGVEAGISQELELFGQRGARVDARRVAVERATAGVANATRLIIGAVDRTFYRLVSASRRLALADEILSLNQRLADVAQRQLTAGEISRLDFNLAVVELGRSRSRMLATRRERTQAALELERLVGLPGDTPIEPVFDPSGHTERELQPLTDSTDTLDVNRLIQRALGHRPDLVERAAASREALAEATLARREALPNLILRAASEPANRGRVLRPGVGLTLPVFNFNHGTVAARRAAARQTELERAAVVRRVGTDIATAAAAYRSAAEEVDVLETVVLGPARQNRQLLETAYREGEVGLPVLLLIRNQAIDAELDYWTAWLAEREALAALLEATGENIRSRSVDRQ